VPDGDLFTAIGQARATVVTDQIETFTETGLQLASGAQLGADVIVTATGLTLLALGGIVLTVDGREIELPETMGYKGRRRGPKAPWRLDQNYARDILSLKHGPLEDGAMEFSRGSAPVTAPEQIAA
jgi:cation diffusion facilitator CzcD-associated flavoprotein CzcO